MIIQKILSHPCELRELFYDLVFKIEMYFDLKVEENIYDHVLAVTFRIFGEKDMRLSNEH